MNASAVTSAAQAGKAWMATAAAHTLSSDQVPALNFTQLGAVLLFAFTMEILDWLGKNPIPVGGEPAALRGGTPP